MKILLDESLPRRLKQHFPERVFVVTVPDQQWHGKKNGELLSLAAAEFDIFVTMDGGIPYQQNLAGHELAVIVLQAVSNRLADLLPLVPELLDCLEAARPGVLFYVPQK
ncbi:MAG: hypothetical protein GXP24_08435 [Planctomycetes bacterium]|nr:hypothetical protein [Planctomycetota bacterium]